MRKNALMMIIYEIAIYLAPLITAPYIARVLGTTGTGIYSYSYSIVTIFTIFCQLGVNLYGRREIASQRTKEEQSKTFWGIWAVETVMFLLCTIVYFVAIWFFEDMIRMALLIQYFSLIGSWLDISWFFFGIEKFKIAISRNLIVKVLSLILVFTTVKDISDTYLYVLIMSASMAVSVAVCWINIGKYVEKPILKEIKLTHFKPMLLMFVPVLSTQLYSIADKIFLGILMDVNAVAIYENAYKISRVPIVMITAIGTIMLPRMTALVSEGKMALSQYYIKKSLSITLILGIGCAFGMIGIAPTFIPFYLGNEFLDSIPILQILAVILIIIAWGNVFRTQYILPHKLDGLYLKSVVAAAIINMILNGILIPQFGISGAAFASVTSELVVCVYQSYKIRDVFKMWSLFAYNIKYLVSGIIMAIVVYFIGVWVKGSDIKAILLQVITGVIIYILVILIFEAFSKEKIMTGEIRRIIKYILRRGV